MPNDAQGPSSSSSGWWAPPAIIALAAVCFGIARFAYGNVVPAVRETFELDAPVLGLLGAVGPLGYLAAIIAGWIVTDRLGARAALTVAGLVAALGLGTVAAATSLPTLMVGMFVTGTSTALSLPAILTLIVAAQEEWPTERLSVILANGTGVGVALTALLGLAAPGGWQLAWAGFAAVALLTTLWVRRTLPRVDTDAVGGLPDQIVRVGDPPSRPIGLALAGAGLGIASSAVWVFGRDVVGGTATSDAGVGSTWLWLLIGVALPLPTIVGDVAHRVGIRPAWTPAMLILAAATASLGVTPPRWGLVLTAVPAFGASYTVATGALLRWGTWTATDRPTDGIRFALLWIVIGHTIGAAVVGELLNALDAEQALLWMAAVAVLASLLGPLHGRDGQPRHRPY